MRLLVDGQVAEARVIYHEWPEQEAAYTYRSQYAFGGASVVVAPVTRRSTAESPLARGLPLWVPPGEWVALHSGQTLRGPRGMLASYAVRPPPTSAPAAGARAIRKRTRAPRD